MSLPAPDESTDATRIMGVSGSDQIRRILLAIVVVLAVVTFPVVLTLAVAGTTLAFRFPVRFSVVLTLALAFVVLKHIILGSLGAFSVCPC